MSSMLTGKVSSLVCSLLGEYSCFRICDTLTEVLPEHLWAPLAKHSHLIALVVAGLFLSGVLSLPSV